MSGATWWATGRSKTEEERVSTRVLSTLREIWREREVLPVEDGTWGPPMGYSASRREGSEIMSSWPGEDVDGWPCRAVPSAEDGPAEPIDVSTGCSSVGTINVVSRVEVEGVVGRASLAPSDRQPLRSLSFLERIQPTFLFLLAQHTQHTIDFSWISCSSPEFSYDHGFLGCVSAFNHSWPPWMLAPIAPRPRERLPSPAWTRALTDTRSSCSLRTVAILDLKGKVCFLSRLAAANPLN